MELGVLRLIGVLTVALNGVRAARDKLNARPAENGMSFASAHPNKRDIINKVYIFYILMPCPRLQRAQRKTHA